MITQLITDLDVLQEITPAWQRLAQQAIEPNVFYESLALLPAIQTLRPANLCVLLVWTDASHPALAGLFPLVQENHYQKIPVCHWRNWLHLHCPLGTPLVHRDYVDAVLAALLQWLYQDVGAMVFSLDKIPADGLLVQHLRTFSQQHQLSLDMHATWERALLATGITGAAYCEQHHRKKKRKEYSRLRRRLTDLGELRCEVWLPGQTGALSTWIADFLRLEEQGWKGQQGTALACHPQEKAFAETLMRSAAQHGQLMMLRLLLDDAVIAMKLNLIGTSQRDGYALKIAYDERYAAYSPGVLLELENICATLDNTALAWMDSCALPNHPMINHLWAERRTMTNLHMSTPRLLSKPLVNTVRLLKTAYRRYQASPKLARAS